MMHIYSYLSIKEKAKALAFEKKHKKCYAGAIGGHISYILTPTGMGMLVDIRCNICKKSIPLNNLDNA